jgi:hypothetical protein
MRREIVKFRRSIVKFSDEAVKISVRSSDSDRSRQIHSKIVKTTFLDNRRCRMLDPPRVDPKPGKSASARWGGGGAKRAKPEFDNFFVNLTTDRMNLTTSR